MQLKILGAVILSLLSGTKGFSQTLAYDLPTCNSIMIAGPHLGEKCATYHYEQVFEWMGTEIFPSYGAWKDSSGLIWSDDDDSWNANSNSLSLAEAQEVCAKLNGRLPTQEELVRAMKGEFFYEPLRSAHSWHFWTSTASIDGNGKSCQVYANIMDNDTACAPADQETADPICVSP